MGFATWAHAWFPAPVAPICPPSVDSRLQAGAGRGAAANAHGYCFGHPTCTPAFVSELTFLRVPLSARWQFGRGRTQGRLYRERERSIDYGFSECVVYDVDGSLSLRIDADGSSSPALMSTSSGRFAYVGCYADDAERDFCCGPRGTDGNECRPGGLGRLDPLFGGCTVGASAFDLRWGDCAAQCAGFAYFALQGDLCFCDNSFGTDDRAGGAEGAYTLLPDDECGEAQPDPYGESLRVGAPLRNAVYSLEAVAVDQPRILVGDAKRRWPLALHTECLATATDPALWVNKDSELLGNARCPLWLRRADQLLYAALDAAQQGVVDAVARPLIPDWGGAQAGGVCVSY